MSGETGFRFNTCNPSVACAKRSDRIDCYDRSIMQAISALRAAVVRGCNLRCVLAFSASGHSNSKLDEEEPCPPNSSVD
jgi:hypothetical protein